ncbi:hypothetical protein JW766_04375 [Candidatus Dojkabacteria bacterium]|nr:hypothetical protein [Candidatus Dojkabacteria bacterium]
MKTICICSSFRFYYDFLDIKKILEKEGIMCLIPEPTRKFREIKDPSKFKKEFERMPEKERLSEARKMTIKHFKKIDNADIIYILANGGYVGKSVSMEVGYSFSKGKTIFSSEPIGDVAVRSLVQNVISKDKLIQYLKNVKHPKYNKIRS